MLAQRTSAHSRFFVLSTPHGASCSAPMTSNACSRREASSIASRMLVLLQAQRGRLFPSRRGGAAGRCTLVRPAGDRRSEAPWVWDG